MKRYWGAMLAAWLCVSDVAAAGWPALMGGAARSGMVAGAPAKDWRALKLSGAFALHGEISASPVAADGRLFVAAENGNLAALGLRDRRLQWLYHAAGGIASTPAVAQGTVYFLSRDGVFHAVDAASGKPRWTFRTGGESRFATYGLYGVPRAQGLVADPWDLYLSSPLVHGGKVYFGSSDERVYALDAGTGELAWTFKTGGMVHSSPALAGNILVVGSWDGAVYALDAASGRERWRFQTRTEQEHSVALGVQASPSIDSDTVYIGSRDGCFYALDLASGRQKWRYDAQGSWIVGTAAQDGKRIYVGTSDTGLLLALDKATGAEHWRFETQVWTYASPLRVGDVLVAASMKGEAVVLDADSGVPRWRYRTAESLRDPMGVIDAKSGGFTQSMMAAHGMHAAVEHVKRLGAFSASPLWADGQLVLATATGEVLFFD